MKKIVILIVIFFTIFIKSNAQILINEYSCSNINTTTDFFNDNEDWIELINTGGTPVNLSGYFISDDPSDLLKWAIPSVGGSAVINAGAKKMVFCSDRDIIAPNGEIHPAIKLRQTYGEWFILSTSAGIVVDSLKLKLTQVGHSRGRTTDGAATFGLFDVPTPNAANTGAKVRYAEKPVFSVAPGNYTTAQSVTMSVTDPLVTIRYTTLGTTPTIASTVYTTPINVTADTVLRARGYSSDPMVLPSFIETNTYFINETSTFDIVSIAGSFTTATNQGNGYLFTGGFNYADQMTSVEYFKNNFAFQYELYGMSERHGHDSWAYPQKGLHIDGMDETGTMASHNYPFFNTTTRDTFDRILLKASGSDNYAGGPNNSAHLRDLFAHTLAEKYNLEMDLRKWKPVLLFVNGRYWGVYDLRENVDNDYFKFYYNKSKKKVDHLSYWGGLEVRQGSDTGWNNLYNYIMSNPMAVQANYEHVKSFLNVESFIQYFIFNEYLVNSDWLNWNTMWWRAKSNGNNNVKWKYVLWDEDAICGLNAPNYTGVGTLGPTNDPCEAASLFPNDPDIKHTDMLTKLFNNPEFEQTYKDQWLMMLNGCFECQNILNHFDSVVNVLTPEMNRQALRWNGTFTDWQTQCAGMRTFISTRCAFIAAALDTCLELYPQKLKLNVSPANVGNIKLDGVLRVPYVWSKTIAGDTIYTLKATPTQPYWTFDRWETQQITNTFSPNINTDSVVYDFNKADSVIAYFVYKNTDSVEVTFDVNPPGTGTIELNGTTLPIYPYTTTLDRRNTYNIIALPSVNQAFVDWTKNNTSTSISPNLQSKAATFTYQEKETIVGNFVYVPPPPPIPPLPPIDKDIFIPSAISPNGDGKNDYFKIQINADVIGLEYELFDRWGNKVFSANKIDATWDGTYKGVMSGLGVYQYFVKAKFRDNTVEIYKGDFTIVK
jgi:gliding motility-associated-like protein